MFKKIFILSIFGLFNLDISCSKNTENFWNYPLNYSDLLKKSEEGDKLSKNEIAKLIYKGVMRYPCYKNKLDNKLFGWLAKISHDDTFEIKVARLFFTQGTSIDSKNTHLEIKNRASKNDPYAQRAMGSLYFYTDLVEISSQAGVQWYLKAAKQGHARAQMSLALRYLEGRHVNKNIKEGMIWLEKAAVAGLPEAQHSLSHLYYSGQYVSKKIKKSYDLLVSAAKGGDTAAQNALAFFHLGIAKLDFSTPKNISEGASWLEKASNSCDPQALFFQSIFYIKGEYFEQNIQKGLELMKKAGELGNEKAAKKYKDLTK